MEPPVFSKPSEESNLRDIDLGVKLSFSHVEPSVLNKSSDGLINSTGIDLRVGLPFTHVKSSVFNKSSDEFNSTEIDLGVGLPFPHVWNVEPSELDELLSHTFNRTNAPVIPYKIDEPYIPDYEVLAEEGDIFPFKIPNITTTGRLFDTMMNHMFDNHRNVNHSIPIRPIVKALVEGETLPTLYPGQGGPLPKLDDIYCNPALMPGGCATLSEWSRVFGVALRDKLLSNPVAHGLQRLGGTANYLHHRAVRTFTPTMVDFVEQEPIVHALESLAHNTVGKLIHFEPDEPMAMAIYNFTGLFFDHLSLLDPDSPMAVFKRIMRSKTKAAAACRLANGLLPFCDLQPVSPGPPVKPPLPRGGPLNSRGFPDFVAVEGFAKTCATYRGCIAGGIDMAGELFDGVYFFADVHRDTGYPIYWKPVRVPFSDSLKSLVLWQGSYKGPNAALVSDHGVFAAITPNGPNFDTAIFAERSAFAFRDGIDPPSACKTPKDFPMCLTGEDKWSLMRYSRGFCSGAYYMYRACLWAVPTIDVYATDIDDA